MARVLVIEDDDGIRSVLEMALQDEGHEVVGVGSAEQGLVHLGSFQPELMVVDVMLHQLSGLDFVRQARQVSSAPILVLSALDAPSTMVEALEAGADDYVTKPFDLDVLGARCRAALRRSAGSHHEPNGEPLVLDAARALVLDLAAARLQLAGDEVHLTDTEFRLLAELARHPGHVVAREVLLEQVWGHRQVVDDGRMVDSHVSRLRTKVELDAPRPRLVVTVRGHGYRLDLS